MKLCLVTLAKQLVNIPKKTKEIIFFFIHTSFNVVESQYERQGPWRVSMDLALWIFCYYSEVHDGYRLLAHASYESSKTLAPFSSITERMPPILYLKREYS